MKKQLIILAILVFNQTHIFSSQAHNPCLDDVIKLFLTEKNNPDQQHSQPSQTATGMMYWFKATTTSSNRTAQPQNLPIGSLTTDTRHFFKQATLRVPWNNTNTTNPTYDETIRHLLIFCNHTKNSFGYCKAETKTINSPTFGPLTVTYDNTQHSFTIRETPLEQRPR